MKAIHALFFLTLGSLMIFLPALLPGYFPPNTIAGSNTSALWLKLMGAVNDVVGAGLLTHWMATTTVSLFGPRPAGTPVAPPAFPAVLRPALGGYAGLAGEPARRLAA